MSRRKGLTLEEKRQKMIEIFYEKKDFFNLKDLEKIAPKEKGIISQSVKDVVQSLVDDGLVDTDKIGSSIYFWALPSKASNNRKRKVDELEAKLGDLTTKCKTITGLVKKARIGREETEERKSVLSKLDSAKKELQDIEAQIQHYKDNDPEVLEEMRTQTVVSKEAVNRWTDNIFSVRNWCKNKFFIEEKDINKQFGIEEDFDYLD